MSWEANFCKPNARAVHPRYQRPELRIGMDYRALCNATSQPPKGGYLRREQIDSGSQRRSAGIDRGTRSPAPIPRLR